MCLCQRARDPWEERSLLFSLVSVHFHFQANGRGVKAACTNDLLGADVIVCLTSQ